MNSHKPSILAIDDTPANLLTLGFALSADFNLQVATSGQQGLDMANINPPDLILLDVMMPEMDGFETCRRFKANPRLSATPIIFLSALSDIESEVAGLALGVADYITKPFQVELVKLRIRNVLQLFRLRSDLQASEERLRYVMEATGEGVWDWALSSGQITHNESWCHILGLDDSYLTHPLDDFIARIHPDDLPQVRSALDSCLAGFGSYASEHRIRHTAGHYLWVADRGQVVARGDDGRPLRMVGSMKNIDERKANEAEIHRLAFYDPLTCLPNRRLLMDRLQQTIIRGERHTTFGALMFLDMDRFKLLNDTHGHAMGDALLIQVASRLEQSLRQKDTVARLGGDEFVVLLDELAESPSVALDSAAVVGRKILAELNRPYDLGSILYQSTPSIGLTVLGGAGETVDAVLKRADLAMYEAKSAGGGQLRLIAGL